MAVLGFHIDFVDALEQAMCSAYVELLCAGVFLVGWLLGVIGKKRRAPYPRGGAKHMHADVDAGNQRRAIKVAKKMCDDDSKPQHGAKQQGMQRRIAPNKDFGSKLRAASSQGDWQLCVRTLREMVAEEVTVDHVKCNSLLSACIAEGDVDVAAGLLLDAIESLNGADVVSYNTIMKGFARSGRIEDCFQTAERMRRRGLSPSQVTYGILLDCCINEKQTERAMDVVDQMTSEGCQMNTVLYTTLIKGFVRGGDLKKAIKVFDQMRAEPSISPDLVTFSIILKAHCDNNDLEAALQLLGDLASLGLKPDEIIFNNLMAGCARDGNARLGKRLYEDMVKSGVRPSNATFSILIRLFHQAKLLDDAVQLLQVEAVKHGLNIESRVFLQLIQACIRERQGARAIQVYRMLAVTAKLNAATHRSILSTCLKLNFLDTAADVLAIAAEDSTGSVDPCDSLAILEAARKKGKTVLVQNITNSMTALGHAVDQTAAKASISDDQKKQTKVHQHGTSCHLASDVSSTAVKHTPPWRTVAAC